MKYQRWSTKYIITIWSVELNNYNCKECRMTKRMTNSCTQLHLLFLLIYTEHQHIWRCKNWCCKTVLNFFLINFKARILRFWSKSHLSSLWSFRSQESQKIKEISKILSAASIPSLLLYHWALFACSSKPSLVCLFVDGSPVSLMALGGFFWAGVVLRLSWGWNSLLTSGRPAAGHDLASPMVWRPACLRE